MGMDTLLRLKAIADSLEKYGFGTGADYFRGYTKDGYGVHDGDELLLALEEGLDAGKEKS